MEQQNEIEQLKRLQMVWRCTAENAKKRVEEIEKEIQSLEQIKNLAPDS